MTNGDIKYLSIIDKYEGIINPKLRINQVLDKSSLYEFYSILDQIAEDATCRNCIKKELLNKVIGFYASFNGNISHIRQNEELIKEFEIFEGKILKILKKDIIEENKEVVELKSYLEKVEAKKIKVRIIDLKRYFRVLKMIEVNYEKNENIENNLAWYLVNIYFFCIKISKRYSMLTKESKYLVRILSKVRNIFEIDIKGDRL